MKRCIECYSIYENYMDICPSCNGELELFSTGKGANVSLEEWGRNSHSDTNVEYENPIGGSSNNTYTFEERSFRSVIINGAIAEWNTQQYYQSWFTKIFYAIFSGEPYQLSHTTFVNIFRVEEHVTRGYPENGRDITLYGNVQNIFAIGDDVQVIVRLKGNRLIAKRVFNHSTDTKVRVQPYLPALFIRMIALIIIIMFFYMIRVIASVNYSAKLSLILGFLISLFPFAIILWLLWKIIKMFFRKR